MRSLSTILVVSVALAVAPNVMAQESPEVLPKVVQHDQPIYPPLARQTRIQGEVRVKVTTARSAFLTLCRRVEYTKEFETSR